MKLFAALLSLIWVVNPVSPEIRYFRYLRPIEQKSARVGQACVVIDPAVFAHAASGLRDLRLYRDTNETPYVIRKNEPAGQGSREVAVLNLGQVKGHTAFDAAMPEGTYGDVELAISGHDFLATVVVTGRQMQTGGPETKLGSYTIFDLKQQKLGRSTVLHLPTSDFRYLHFEIEGNVSPDVVNGLNVSGAGGEPNYVAVSTTSSIKQQGHQTLIEFTLPARTPVDRVFFAPGTQPANFSRNVEVSVKPVSSPKLDAAQVVQSWTRSGNLLRVHRAGDGHPINAEHLDVAAPRNDMDEETLWTISVDNGDDPPIDLKSVRLEMVRRDLCFDAVANASYKLYYGDDALNAPRYDYASLFKLQNDAEMANLGPETANPTFEPRPDSRPFTERHPILLWVALGAVVLLLGVITVRTAKSSGPAARS